MARFFLYDFDIARGEVTCREGTVAPSPQERRTDELRLLRRLDPAQSIDRYKGITGTPTDGQLPYGVSFDAMIAAIVTHEDETGELRGEDW